MKKLSLMILIFFFIGDLAFSQKTKDKGVKKTKNTLKKKMIKKKSLKKEKKLSLKKRTLIDYNEEYQEKVNFKKSVRANSLLKKNMNVFLKKLKKDLMKQDIEGRIVIRNFNFSSELLNGEYDRTVLNNVFFNNGEKETEESENIDFVVNRYKNKVFYKVSEKGLEIEKGVTKSAHFSKILKKEKSQYYMDLNFIFIGGKLKMIAFLYDSDDEQIFNKTYVQRYKQYGILQYRASYIHLGLGVNFYSPNWVTQSSIINPRIPLFIVPNFFIGSYLYRFGTLGGQVDVGIINGFDFLNMKIYLNWNIMESFMISTPVGFIFELSMGGGLQRFNNNFSPSFFSIGVGGRILLYDIFYIRGGFELFINKRKSDGIIKIIDNTAMPPSINFGIGFYIL